MSIVEVISLGTHSLSSSVGAEVPSYCYLFLVDGASRSEKTLSVFIAWEMGERFGCGSTGCLRCVELEMMFALCGFGEMKGDR